MFLPFAITRSAIRRIPLPAVRCLTAPRSFASEIQPRQPDTEHEYMSKQRSYINRDRQAANTGLRPNRRGQTFVDSRFEDKLLVLLEELSRSEPSRNNMPADLHKLREAVALNKPINAWNAYERLMRSNPESLTMMEHLQYLSILRFTRKNADFEAMEEIFKNLETLKFDIPAVVYDAMIRRSSLLGPELVDKYLKKMIAKHGPESQSIMTISCRMNALRRVNKHQEVIDLAAEAEKLGIDVHEVKPIIMAAYMKLNDTASAQSVFDSYLSNERGYLNISKAHGWMAMELMSIGEINESKAVIANLDRLKIHPDRSVWLVQMRLAIHDNDLDLAMDYAMKVLERSRTDSFGNAVPDLVEALLTAGHFNGAEELLEAYGKKYESIPNLRFLPYMKAMEFHANSKNAGARGADEIERIFNMVPSAGKYKNRAILQSAVTSLVNAGNAKLATDLLRYAHTSGFPQDDELVNMSVIDRLESEIGVANASSDGASPNPSASTSVA